MLTFKPVAQRDLSRLRRYYKNCNYQLCEYSALVKLMWRGHLHPQYAEAAGCLIVKNCIDGKPCFDYPVPGPDGDEEAALCAIEDYCVEQGISLELSVVPQEKAPKLLERYPRFHLNNFRSDHGATIFTRRTICASSQAAITAASATTSTNSANSIPRRSSVRWGRMICR